MPPPPTFRDGIAQFNQGEFYDCHDTLEAIWMTADIPDKPFYQGILQIAVALYHLSNHNWRGAAILFGEGSRRLEPYEPTYYGINVTDLLDRAAEWLIALQELGPEQVAQVATALIPPQAPEMLSEADSSPRAVALQLPSPQILPS
ncbi:DUF309 domain-containing protein [Leptolyngbya sp. PCC 6406]|uniref:DUF309 domain-containing protein n=1 Tax=Leptolyngbya sp. PCC 6406 TaxID=1173264 RepID=UPI0003057EE1|nr:DUF309 domain-containing protein [Leptolyngbya sp. PCC 6406]